ncbi:GntR family transcriptional regulator [Gordonia neofelifaecis]|uniref:GntR family transcriptional regulator n=1 Tax=Gordonia neofelifaecis NRRL B-59395 TaxID=644548 RepID=F1YKJ6_9ACTN|nr:GntR family transcriptional regulator [Gordonia neofelifaecis]EGD54640.1 GntR family transcriptional regulator [Gordonia neofelifaecis NRRL B-59395]
MPKSPDLNRRRRADAARLVADVLRRGIDRGDRADRLDEQRLADEFGVSRNAIRDALALLSAEGRIDRGPRVGTRVARRRAEHGIDELCGLSETLAGYGCVRNEIRVATIVRAPAAVARRLHLEPSADVVYIERLRFLDQEPVSLDLTYLVPDVGVPLLGLDLENHDVFGLIEHSTGRPLHSARHSVEAATADPHSAAILDVPPGAALLLIERLTALGPERRPVDLEYIRMRSDRITLHATALRAASEH